MGCRMEALQALAAASGAARARRASSERSALAALSSCAAALEGEEGGAGAGAAASQAASQASRAYQSSLARLARLCGEALPERAERLAAGGGAPLDAQALNALAAQHLRRTGRAALAADLASEAGLEERGGRGGGEGCVGGQACVAPPVPREGAQQPAPCSLPCPRRRPAPARVTSDTGSE